MQSHSENGPSLEAQLRDLILTNSTNPGEVQNMSTAVRDSHEHGSDGPQNPPPGSRPGRKRPNQAQRRQMNAQISIPIDPRVGRPPPATGEHRRGPDFQQRAVHSRAEGPRPGFRDHASPVPPVRNPQYGHQHRPREGFGQMPSASPTYTQNQHDWRRQQPQRPENPPRGVNVISAEAFAPRPSRNAQANLYNVPGHRQYVVRPEELAAQAALLGQLCAAVVDAAEIQHGEIAEKESFRLKVEETCRNAVYEHERVTNGANGFDPCSVQLKCFGSLSSGFATKAADMDLGLLSPTSLIAPDAPESPIPRLVEKVLLEAGFGARLLTRTRVPIIKLCEKPTTQLRHDMLEERTKWEKGIVDDEPDPIDDEIGLDDLDSPVAAAADRSLADAPKGESGPSTDITQPKDAAAKNSSNPLASLKQSEKQSLSTYYSLAKRTLRRMKGRDATVSNVDGFTEADFMLLDDVSGAFVNGLRDQQLKNRVQAFASFSAGRSMPNYRNLQGVYNLVEGERLVMLWESLAVPEQENQFQQAHVRHVSAWGDLQKTRTFGTNPLSFSKDLHMAVERLRQIPLIQLMQLQQDQFESPTDYLARATRIKQALAASQADIMHYYVSGIRNADIRQAVRDFVQSNGAEKSLVHVARRHKSLHLAEEYKRALEHGLYEEGDVPVIWDYISILQGGLTPMDSIPAGPCHPPNYSVCIPDSFWPAFLRIRELPSPSRLAPNQPRDRYNDKLEIPKSGVGVQCDINFSADLALQNTLLLRCYSYCDPRVRPMVLFVKHWAKARGINTAYRGTLSSYGYVLMVLHYLVNIVQPFVCPNLQLLAQSDPNGPPAGLEGITACKGRDVRFWRDEQAIQRLALEGGLNHNRDSIGVLLRGFFEYYAQNNLMSTIQKRGFDWGRDVLSLRTPGGLVSKHEKGWVSAKTVIQAQHDAAPAPVGFDAKGEVPPASPTSSGVASKSDAQPAKPKDFKEVRHRYLFAIEDPFELEHNVARTVTHNGIVAIRDEFRRAWRIIKSTGKNSTPEDLLEDVKLHNDALQKRQFAELLGEIHGVGAPSG